MYSMRNRFLATDDLDSIMVSDRVLDVHDTATVNTQSKPAVVATTSDVIDQMLVNAKEISTRIREILTNVQISRNL